MTDLFHGAHTSFALHLGQCFTDDRDSAETYANGCTLVEVAINMNGLSVVEVDGYDPNTDDAPADLEEDRAALEADGVDIIEYDDADENGQEHRTWRIISARALAAVTVAEITDLSDDEEDGW